VQFRPELKPRPFDSQPLFRSVIAAAAAQSGLV
jgi:CTP synthase (UTP-ammonia lyase)